MNSGETGVSTLGLLGVLFVGLKLGGVIAWPWLYVLAPFWGSLVITLFVLSIIAIAAPFSK